MSRRANCYDKAQAESFFSRYKAELLEGGLFESVSQARSETFSYIEGYYNRERRHSALGYKTPDEFEREWKTKTKGASSERVMSGKT
jgi:putative transposase